MAQENVEKIGLEPVGTGPFRFVERVPNSHLLVRRWEKFYVPGQPKVDEIRWVPVVEPATRVANLRTGTADIISEVPHCDAGGAARATPGIALHEPKASSAYAVILLKHAPPLDNKKVRQALAMLVDREALNRSVFFGVGTTAQGCNPFPVGHWAHADVNCPKYDPEGAKKLLAEAGIPAGDRARVEGPELPAAHQDRRGLQGDVQARRRQRQAHPARVRHVDPAGLPRQAVPARPDDVPA